MYVCKIDALGDLQECIGRYLVGYRGSAVSGGFIAYDMGARYNLCFGRHPLVTLTVHPATMS